MPERAPLDYERVTPPPRRSHSSLWRMLIVFALLIIIILGFDVLWLTPTHRRSAESAYQANCSNNLRQIGLAIQTYADGNSLQFPTELGALILLQGGPSADVFVCPSSSDRRLEAPAAQQAAALLSGRHCSYVYVGAGMTSAAGSDDVVAFDLPANHDKNGGNVLYGDASIQWEHFETLVQLVPELEAGRNPPVTRALTPAQAKQLYDQKWVPKLANLKDGTWAASLPQPATRPSAASPQPNGFERLSPAEEQQRDTSGR